MSEEISKPVVDLEFQRGLVNAALLHQQLKTALGDYFTGISSNGQQLRVHIYDNTPQALQAQIAPVVSAHDPNAKTPDQQQRVDRETRLNALRKSWGSWTALDREAFLRILAEQAGIVSE